MKIFVCLALVAIVVLPLLFEGQIKGVVRHRSTADRRSLPAAVNDQYSVGLRGGESRRGVNCGGYLPAGQHVIVALVDPFQVGKRPGRKTLNVQAGQTYTYTAAWSGGKLVLVRNP